MGQESENISDNKFKRVYHIQKLSPSVVGGWGRVNISCTARESAYYVGCDMVFQFFGSVGIKVSGVDMGFVGGVICVRGENVEKLLKLVLIQEDVDASQVKDIIVQGGGE